MMTKGRQQLVWSIGLLMYVASSFILIFAGFLIPVVGASILLACSSMVGSRPKDDTLVAVIATIELVAAGLMWAMLQVEWLRPLGGVTGLIGLALPIATMGYRLFRPPPTSTPSP